MAARRAPLFSVSLAFAIGCLLGLVIWPEPTGAVALWLASGGAWLLLSRRPNWSHAAFFIFVIASGWIHTVLLTSTIPADNLRRLPVEKAYPSTQWRGEVAEEPSSDTPPHGGRRSLQRTSFTLRIDGWRPTGGALFGEENAAAWLPARGAVQCTLLGPAAEIAAGDRLECAGALREFSAPLNPGELDFRDYEAKQGVSYEMSVAPLDWRLVAAGSGRWWRTLSFRARDWAEARLRLGLEDDPRTADFLAGMLIGYRQGIPLDIEQDFRRTGTLHVFAVSGQNIAEMVVVAIILLQLFGLVRWRWAWLLVPVVLLYCLLTGSPASAVRATVMALAVLGAWRLGRPLNGLACWSLAFLAMLVWNPEIVLDPGAQLSFTVVLALVLVSGPLGRLLARPLRADPFLPRELFTVWQRREEKFWSRATLLFAAAIAAELASDPITMISFHQITPISIFANLVVVPTAGAITAIGTLSVAVSLFSPLLAGLLNNANWLLARLLILFVAFLAHRPGASINVPDLRTLGEPLPRFFIAPVQDTACLLVRTGSRDWLVNTGRENPARTITSRLLQYYGVNRLDALVLAQRGQADNSGADVIARDFPADHLVAPPGSTHSPVEKVLATLPGLTGRGLETWTAGTTRDLGSGVRVTVLHPAAGDPATHAEDRALVLLFQAGGQTLLWAGKIDAGTQAELLATDPSLHADVLVLGVDSAPTAEWLRALQVREWLQIPSRDQRLNSTAPAPAVPPFCRVWPLAQTGGVDLCFVPAEGKRDAEIVLRPFVAGPPETAP